MTAVNMKQFQKKDRQEAIQPEVDNISKDKWLQKYSCKVLSLWLQQPAPFGVTFTYTTQIKEDLTEFYEDPLKRKFIESTYYGHSYNMCDEVCEDCICSSFFINSTNPLAVPQH